MRFKRQIYSHLVNWKSKVNRKPLILRGARQVGKTTVIQEFSKEYKHFIMLNLERLADLKYFQEYTDASTIVEALFISNNLSSSDKENTLLFIDEIQESSKAISFLRYFYEDEPELHVIAAGSLLEHVMSKAKNYPVGRVEYLYMYPLNFAEYLVAKRQSIAHVQLQLIPVSIVAHQTFMDLFHEYAIIGGMPEIVARYLVTNSIADLPTIYESIWKTYKEDIEKYASNATESRIIRHIISTAFLYIDQRIKFENFGQSNYRSREVSESLRNLDDAKIIQLIYPTTDITPPQKSNLKKSPRLQFLDTGIVNHELNIQATMLAMGDLNNAYKGSIIPHLITQEIISLQTFSYKKPNFWVREKAQSTAEVDLVLSYKNKLIPIEIKSGKEGTLRSLHQFIEAADHCYGIRIYGGIFNIEKQLTSQNKKPYLLMNLPYYLGTKINEYMAYFIENYALQ